MKQKIIWTMLLAGAVAAPAMGQTSGSAAIWATQGLDCKAPAGVAEPWRDKAQKPECRARFVLSQLKTLDDKLAFLVPPQGTDPGARFGIPRVGGSDGPAGLVRSNAGATALPSPLAVAASFDPAVATRYGTVLADEFRAAGLGTILGPAFDLARTWKFGRLSESMGEDPLLIATMAGAEVRAISDGGVIATMKHYAVYGQEAGRVGDQPSGSAPTGDNIVSEKALREIYLPGFEAAVKQGGAGAVMCSFPRVNGVYACENPHLLDVLKREWRFDGTVGPDFPSAQRSITRAVVAGLDSTASPSPVNAALAQEKPFAQAVRDGDIPEARVDDMILRRLIPLFRLGLYDNPPKKLRDEAYSAANRAAAADILAAGTVLLKNERGMLPFGPRVRSVAVIGVNATQDATVVEQGSPYVKPAHFQPALPAIERRAGKRVSVNFAPGTSGLGALPPLEPRLVTAPRGGHGFLAEYFANPNLDFSGKPFASAVVADPSLAKAPDVAGLPANNQWSVRYRATFTPPESGVHRFTLHGAGTARLLIGGKPVAGFEMADFGNAAYANVPIEAGQPVAIEIDYTPRSALMPQRTTLFGMEMGLTLRVGHEPPNALIERAAMAARKADVAVVFAGERVGEGMDRPTLALQGDQDRLIEAVAAANPNTVVVLSTGGPVAMPWLGKVRGVLETWLPGDAFGPAIAAMLFGDREPGGRLPVTFPADETQGPATHRREFPGLTDPATGRLTEAYFDEGVFVGYRYYQAHQQKPLFPFGYGLGYGQVRFDQAEMRGSTLRVRLTNTGTRPTTAVPEVYVGMPTTAREPPRQLKAFANIGLAPGESRTVELPFPQNSIRYWDSNAEAWRVPGDLQVMLGRSSEDIVWQDTIGGSVR